MKLAIIKGSVVLPIPDVWQEEITLVEPSEEQKVQAIALIKVVPVTIEEVILP